jgi:hypothetical protein
VATNLEHHVANPELERQLRDAEPGNKPVQAIVVLRPDSEGKTALVVKDVLDRVERRTGEKTRALNVFPNLRSFVVEAPPQFLRELLEQSEIQSAMPNRPPGSAFIPPVRKRRVR